MVTLMAGAEAIRDVIAFPKTQRGQDLLTGAPTPGQREAAARASLAPEETAAAVRWLVAAALAFCSCVLAFVLDIKASSCPLEARQTLALIQAGGPFPYAQDGKTCSQSRKAPADASERGYYREYTVKTPGRKTAARAASSAVDAARRLHEYFYTDDHYRSFKRIIE